MQSPPFVRRDRSTQLSVLKDSSRRFYPEVVVVDFKQSFAARMNEMIVLVSCFLLLIDCGGAVETPKFGRPLSEPVQRNCIYSFTSMGVLRATGLREHLYNT